MAAIYRSLRPIPEPHAGANSSKRLVLFRWARYTLAQSVGRPDPVRLPTVEQRDQREPSPIAWITKSVPLGPRYRQRSAVHALMF